MLSWLLSEQLQFTVGPYSGQIFQGKRLWCKVRLWNGRIKEGWRLHLFQFTTQPLLYLHTLFITMLIECFWQFYIFKFTMSSCEQFYFVLHCFLFHSLHYSLIGWTPACLVFITFSCRLPETARKEMYLQRYASTLRTWILMSDVWYLLILCSRVSCLTRHMPRHVLNGAGFFFFWMNSGYFFL